MKKNIFIALSLSFVMSILSCNSQRDANFDDSDIQPSLTDSLLSVSKKCNFKEDFADVVYVLICPIDIGCETCIQKTLTAISKNKNSRVVSIITSQSASSLKKTLAQYGFSSEQFNSKNILLDSSNYCFKSGLSDVTPRIYKMEGKRIASLDLLYALNIDNDLSVLK